MSVKSKSADFDLPAAPAPDETSTPQSHSGPSRWRLDAIVAELRLSREVTHNIRPKGRFRRPPARAAIATIVEGLAASLFPAHYGGPELAIESLDYFVGRTLNRALAELVEQVRLSLSFASESEPDEAASPPAPRAIVKDFAAALPGIRGLLVNDLRAAFSRRSGAGGLSRNPAGLSRHDRYPSLPARPCAA